MVLEYRFKEHSCSVSSAFPLVLPREEPVQGETAPQQSRSSKGTSLGRKRECLILWLNKQIHQAQSQIGKPGPCEPAVRQPCTSRCYSPVYDILLSPLFSTTVSSTSPNALKAECGAVAFFPIYRLTPNNRFCTSQSSRCRSVRITGSCSVYHHSPRSSIFFHVFKGRTARYSDVHPRPTL